MLALTYALTRAFPAASEFGEGMLVVFAGNAAILVACPLVCLALAQSMPNEGDGKTLMLCLGIPFGLMVVFLFLGVLQWAIAGPYLAIFAATRRWRAIMGVLSASAAFVLISVLHAACLHQSPREYVKGSLEVLDAFGTMGPTPKAGSRSGEPAKAVDRPDL
ncbi:MAG TPA: hypothetical protein VNI01_15120, partial [Elusimicrobiota bacterium]|nr:hypothetical protein [Elusimicrobiota bacterium]